MSLRQKIGGFGLLIFFKQKYYETERYFPFVINNVDLKPEIDIIFLVITKFYLQLSISNQYSGFQTSNSLQESALKLRIIYEKKLADLDGFISFQRQYFRFMRWKMFIMSTWTNAD